MHKLLAEIAVKHGVDNCAAIDGDAIIYRREFRDACAVNYCGKYCACWMCPPDVGDIDVLMNKAKKYRHAFVYQTIGQLEDSFDIEGMQEAAKRHNMIACAIAEEAASLLGKHLHLCAGACHICETCAKQTQEPCRYPGKAVPSLESHGVDVSELAKAAGMKYINGVNTVTYFGAFLY